MSGTDIERSEAVKLWFDALPGLKFSARTRTDYLYSLKQFCDFVKMSPDEIIKLRKQDLESEDERKRYRFEILLKSNKFLRARPRVDIFALISFFEANYVSIRVWVIQELKKGGLLEKYLKKA